MLILCSSTSKRECYSLTKGEVQWNWHSEFPEDSEYGNLFSWTAPGCVNIQMLFFEQIRFNFFLSKKIYT